MRGHVDGEGRALLSVAVLSSPDKGRRQLEAWVDTGFTGDLVLPMETVLALGLSQSAIVPAELGDGTQTSLEVYACLIDWFGQPQRIDVVAAETGKSPLLGVGLLQDRRLVIDYASRVLTLE